jgi:hypothetical protein
MDEATQAIADFQVAIRDYVETCSRSPMEYHAPAADVFQALVTRLRPAAEAGHLHSQYALATIHLMKLTCASVEEEQQYQQREIEQATRWLVAAARQGCWSAVDNLVSSGVGPEAEHAREGWRKLEAEQPDLIGKQGNIPVYGPSFIKELCRRLYGKVIDA